MAKLHISEFGGLMQTSGGVGPLVSVPPLAQQAVTYTTAVASVAFGTNTKVIRVCADADAYLLFAAAPVADGDDMLVPGDVIEYFYVQPGDKVSAYDGSS